MTPGPLSTLRGFQAAALDREQIATLEALARAARADVLTMCARAGSGHPGGSLSSLDLYLLLWTCARGLDAPMETPDRDRIVISHGHTTAGVYAVLGQLGLVEREAMLAGFRRAGSIFEGHPSDRTPGIEWCGGNLGQGLSVGCGFALAARLRGEARRVFVVMGDGEQQKGQVMEAVRFAAKYAISNLTVIVDLNGLQAMGRTAEIMPQSLAEEYAAAGWAVDPVDGHDYSKLYEALREAYQNTGRPTLILAHTAMGKGVSFLENRHEYHGKILAGDPLERALKELSPESAGTAATLPRPPLPPLDRNAADREFAELKIDPGQPHTYPSDASVECRTAWGQALIELAERNADRVPIAVLDCDLHESVKTTAFAKAFPDRFFQCGIAEHHAASLAGGLAKAGVLTFWADFAVFGLQETFNQQRLNDINRAGVKLVLTHCGLDVGEDGKTHECVDYVNLLASFRHFRLLIPADANQADHLTRAMAGSPGNVALAMGRSKLPILCDAAGAPCFGREYQFRYGQGDWLARGVDATIVTCGAMTHRALAVHEALAREGLRVGVLSLTTPLALDEAQIREAAATGRLITYEDHNVRTGLGVLIGTMLAERELGCRFLRLGVSAYGGSGAPEELYRAQGLDVDSVAERIRDFISKGR
jgi:transketolase